LIPKNLPEEDIYLRVGGHQMRRGGKLLDFGIME